MGVRVPIEVVVDTDTKQFTVKVRTPSTSALIGSAAEKSGWCFCLSRVLRRGLQFWRRMSHLKSISSGAYGIKITLTRISTATSF